MKPTVYLHPLERISYPAAWDKQESLLADAVQKKLQNRRANTQHSIQNHLLFCEHPPVFTLGKAGSLDHLLVSEKQMEERGIEFFKINRGGDITFHGLEQLVGYPVFDLEQFKPDLHEYLRQIEDVIILTLADYGLEGMRVPEYTGVWLEGERKICAIGVRAKQWVSMHGFALNVNTDLSFFDLIVPCGIEDKAVTSLEKELGRKVPLQEVADRAKIHFETVFGLRFGMTISAET